MKVWFLQISLSKPQSFQKVYKLKLPQDMFPKKGFTLAVHYECGKHLVGLTRHNNLL